ncbi:Na(+) H(+) antiporter subunit A [hydrothermal vent metagenome]|uniref:Na(+) H(+) antiporter subunit A n=1 Tax=hydrothermal vent metagenome TaxID=652676 RepID=A0A3B0VPS4_9ZZZZ
MELEAIQSLRPLYAILASSIGVLLIGLSWEKPNLREFWTILAAVIKFAIIVSMVPFILKGGVYEYSLLTVAPGLELAFRADALGMVFATVSSLLWIVTSFYSIGYMRKCDEKNQTRYFMCFAATMAATIGVAFSANLFTLFLCYEAITLCTFPLVGHKQTPEARRGARIYMIYLLGTSLAFLLFAIFLTYNAAGTLNFTHQGILAGKGSTALLTIIFVLFMVGITKAGMMPFHNWLPAAMVAPTPVSALLHAVAVVKAGVFTVLRVVFFIFGTDLLNSLGISFFAAYFICFTIIMASVIALTRDNLKARLAYSTISQLSYILLGAVMLTPSSLIGAIIHIANHAFSKITLFFCAGHIYAVTHKTKISQLGGIGKKMPWTMAAFFVASLSMIGVPPVAGFVTKWYLAVGTVEADNPILLVVLLASTMLNAAYFLPISYKAFFGKERPEDAEEHGGEHHTVRELPMMTIPLVFTALASVFIGLYPDFFIALAKEVLRP